MIYYGDQLVNRVYFNGVIVAGDPAPAVITQVSPPSIAPTLNSEFVGDNTTQGTYTVNEGTFEVVTTWKDDLGAPVLANDPLTTGQIVIAVDTVVASQGGTTLVVESAPITIGLDFDTLFDAAQAGFLTNATDKTTLFQDPVGTIPVTGDGQVVGRVSDVSGNAFHLTEDTNKPIFRESPNRIDVSSGFVRREVLSTITGTLILATQQGTLAYGVTVPSSSTLILGGSQYPGTTLIDAFLRAGPITEAEIEAIRQEFISRGAGNNYSGVTSIVSYYQSLGRFITDFPANADFSNAVDCRFAFRFFAGTTFPPLAFTSMRFGGNLFRSSDLVTVPSLSVPALINADRMYQDSTDLANAPAGVFDNCPCTNWTDAFLNTNLTTTAIDNILVSINSNGTSGGTFVQSGGSAPSATGEAAITAMRSRGWTIAVTGGF